MKITNDHIMTDAMPAKKRGRPLSFDRETALEKAMLLFWQYGYEATSIHDLTQMMGITAPSLYTAFGDKEHLFMETIQYYLQKNGCEPEKIFNTAPTAKIAIEIFLHENAVKLTQPSKPHGCMIVTATTNCSDQSAHLQTALQEKRQQTKQLIKARLQRGLDEGDIAATIDVEQLTNYFATVLQGMTIQARDGASQKDLQGIGQMAMTVLAEV